MSKVVVLVEHLEFILEVLKGSIDGAGEAISVVNEYIEFGKSQTSLDKAMDEYGGMDRLIEKTLGRLKDKGVKDV